MDRERKRVEMLLEIQKHGWCMENCNACSFYSGSSYVNGKGHCYIFGASEEVMPTPEMKVVDSGENKEMATKKIRELL